ncbi:Z1 domain-containing protein [Paenibacillus sp. NRS-1783]|uniref:Z1 domain-containing protein n=1 Tax=Paenibacillus sp. NRS-1783 TaxID=3233907 RepID=UPI003D268519
MSEVKIGINVFCVEIFMQKNGITKADISKTVEKSKEVYSHVVKDEKKKTGLIFGKVQSGKTNNIITSMSVFMDNGFDFFLLFTSNDISLNNQTLGRLKESRLKVEIISKERLQHFNDFNTFYAERKKVVIVCPKHVRYISKLNSILDNSKSYSVERWIVFDDEADEASLNNNTNRDLDPTRTNQLIENVISKNNIYAYIQVTATPQAILLQNVGSKFHPDFICVMDPGKGYIGGDELFGEYRNNYVIAYRDNKMFDGDREINERTEMGIANSILSFLIAAAIKIIHREESTFSYMAHVSRSKEGHNVFKQSIEKWLEQFIRVHINTKEHTKEVMKNLNDIFWKMFDETYCNFKKTVTDIPEKDDVIDIVKSLLKEPINIKVINSDNNHGIIYSGSLNMFIGGDRLSRGITLNNLITTYYSRTTNVPKMDTINQHARMYGYRGNVIDVLRVFISVSSLDYFTKITRAENELRKLIINNKSVKVSIPIGKGMSPTRDTVYEDDNILGLRGGITYNPKYPTFINVVNYKAVLDKKLQTFIGKGSDPAIEVGLDFIIEILTIIENVDGGFSKLVCPLINAMKENFKEAYIVARIDRDIKRNDSGAISTILSEEDRSLAKEDHPTLYIYRILGSKDKGWNDESFWVPSFRFPNSADYLVNMS